MPPPYLGPAKNANLVMMFGYAHGRYLMAKTYSSPDVDDDDDSTIRTRQGRTKSARCWANLARDQEEL